MPDLERRIKDGLGRLEQRPDPAGIVERVGMRKSRIRTVRRVQTVTLVVVVLAGVAGSVYGLTRAFGIGPGEHAPGSSVGPSPTVHHSPPAGLTPCSGQSA